MKSKPESHQVSEAALAAQIYRDLILSKETLARLADGEEPGELHAELARRSVMAASTLFVELRAHSHQPPQKRTAHPPRSGQSRLRIG